ncbi:MAG TPA: tetratricopeptide repeat protein [Rugosimonospora sp.]|nr:tetratricopeptide repeat protein [Rugosimonospora sp.]
MRSLRAGWALHRARNRGQLARYWMARGDLDEAAVHARRALRLVRAGPSPPPHLAADLAMLVARVERDRDNAAASQEALLWTVERLEAAPAGHRRDQMLGATLAELGDAHRRAGRYPQATAALRQAHQLLAGNPVAEPIQLAGVVTQQGILAKELGEYQDAARCYAQVGRILATAGAPAAAEATLQHNLAGLAHIQHQYQRAETHARQAVALRRRVPRVSDVDIALDLAVLAAALAGQQRHDEARDLFEQAMAACQQARPPRRYEVAVHLHNLAAIDQASGFPHEAERRYRQALALKEELLGPQHPEIGLLANNLGTLLHDQGRDAAAAACYERALRLVTRHYPPDHPAIAAISANLTRAAAAERVPQPPS